MASSLPTGTVTFLFTDIESSARTAQAHPDVWEKLRARHNTILRSAIEREDGHVFQVVGDAFCAAFQTVSNAIHAAVRAQSDLQAEPWGDSPMRVRMGIHSGEAREMDGEYQGYLTLTRTQRVMSVAYGGQILVSNAGAELVRSMPSNDLNLKDLGEHRLKDLPGSEHIWQVIAADLRQDFPPLASLATIPNNLPAQLTSFVGRQAEMAQVRELLKSHRLVTLTGAGGTGKTRLSLQVAAEVLPDFKDGVWFVELAPLSEPGLVPNTVASVLGIRVEENRSPLSTLLDVLSGKQLLLVLDNCEHLIGACAQFSEAVLHAGSATRILASSREALGVSGETAFVVPSLECPEPEHASGISLEQLTQYEAVHLFTERATEAAASFRLSADNAPAVAQICARLDGIPLAIELAAARLRVLRAEQIAERLNDRFRLLTGGGRTALPRHQTLRSLIDWSYSLLTEPERILLRRLSAFAGGWTLEAAEQVCADGGVASQEVLDLLAHLVDKSLVVVDEAAKEPRYRMLETIREYAREKLADSGETAQVRQRHADFMLQLVEEMDAHNHSPQEGLWQDRLQAEIDNLRAALEWAIALDDTQPALTLVACSGWFWWVRGYWQEAHRWMRAALARAGAEQPTRARAYALTMMAWFRYMAGEFDAGRELAAESFDISRGLHDKQGLARSLTAVGVASSVSDSAHAGHMLEEGLVLSRELHYPHGMAWALSGLANCRALEGNDEAAQTYYEEAIDVMRQMGDAGVLASARRFSGFIALRQGNYAKAFSGFAESLELNMQTGDLRGVAASLEAIGSIAARQGDSRRAVRLYGAAAGILESLGVQFIPMDVRVNEPYVHAARQALGPDEYERESAQGRIMSLEQALAFARERAGG